jgi:alkanesulfonate monooxygenase SsuD/methylene tetrahydromethanopterin reductase-like flavin-dependent oxidoreductase (luciferase family)
MSAAVVHKNQHCNTGCHNPHLKTCYYYQLNDCIYPGLLSGNEFSYKGKFFNFQGFPKLVPKPLSIPILFGSSADKMLKLAGEVADDTILNSIGTEEYFKHAISVMHDATKEARQRYKVL